MVHKIERSEIFKKEQLLFIVLAGIFVCNALVAEFIGVKIFSLEKTLGFDSLDMSFFGQEGLGFNLTAGVLLWPIIFVLTDVINEYFGRRGVKILSYLAAVLIGYAFVVIYFSIGMTPADFWPHSHYSSLTDVDEIKEITNNVGDYNAAYKLVFGQGLWIIVGSLVAFLIGQFLDVYIFHKIKQYTGETKIWLRATGSTLVSQFIDSFVVLFIAFYIGAGWDIYLVLAIGVVNYIYKFVVSIVLTPVIYLMHFLIDRYLGHELAMKLRSEAMLK